VSDTTRRWNEINPTTCRSGGRRRQPRANHGSKEYTMRRTLTLLLLSAATLVLTAGTADAQWRARRGTSTAVISVGLGSAGIGYGQSYYTSQPTYYSNQPYYGWAYSGLQTSSPYGTTYGSQSGYPSYSFGLGFNQAYYSLPSNGPRNGYGGQHYQHQSGSYPHRGGGNVHQSGGYHHR
jgi:hypothetical protein